MNEGAVKRRLPFRDLFLLPLIAVATAVLILIVTEGVSRIGWAESKYDQCTSDDGAVRPKPNCISRNKAVDGPWVETRYNDCGYRATGPCGPVKPGVVRIAVLGSSTSWGYLVSFDQVWSVQAARVLSDLCRHAIDIQSLGGFGNLNDIAVRLPEAVGLDPQLVILAIGPYDLFEMPDGGFDPEQALRPNKPLGPPRRAGFFEHAKSMLTGSRALAVAQQFLYKNAEAYVSNYLSLGDRAAFLRPPMSPEWQARLSYLDAGVGYIAQRLAPKGIPLLLALAPLQVQADIIGNAMDLSGVDADALDRTIAGIAKRHGALFADGALAFRGVKDAPSYFYRADGHLNGAGNELLGRAVANAVLADQTTGICE